MKILLFLFPFVAFSQAVSWSENQLIKTTTINNSIASGNLAFASSSGFSAQVDIACAVCAVQIRILGSVDGTVYQTIPELTKNYTAGANVLYNVYMQFFKWMRMEIEETSGNDTTVKAVVGVKSQL